MSSPRAFLPQDAPIRIVIVGDGSLRRDVEEAAAGYSRVEVVPPVPHEQYSDVLAAADVLVLHEREGVAEMSMPSKLTSYLAAGRPVLGVTSLSGATSEFLRATGAAMLVEPGDAQSTAEALLALVGDSSGLRGLSDAAGRYASAHPTQEAGLRSTRRFVQQLVANRP